MSGRIKNSDYYFDYSQLPDTSPWSQDGFTAQSGHEVSISDGALIGDSGGSDVFVSWRNSAHPVMTKGEIFAQVGSAAGTTQGQFYVGCMDDAGNGYIVIPLRGASSTTQFQARKVTSGELIAIGSNTRLHRSFSQGDVFSIRFEVIEGAMHLEVCFNGNAVISYIDDSSPHITNLKPEWGVSEVGKINAIGVNEEIIRPEYIDIEVGLSTEDYTEGTIDDNVTRAATFSPFKTINDLRHTTLRAKYGDYIPTVAIAARNEGDAVTMRISPYTLTEEGVPDERVRDQNVVINNAVSEWQTADIAVFHVDVSNLQGVELAVGATQAIPSSGTAYVRMGRADGYSAAGLVPNPFGTATPYYIADGTPNSPNVKMIVRRQVWPKESWRPVEFIEPVKFFG